MHKIILSGIFYLSVIIGYAQTGHYVPELAPLDSVITQFMHRWRIPQGSVAVVKDGRLVYARAFGQSEAGNFTQPEDIFRIASLSKPITATCIMKLVDKGWLDLDAPVFGEFGILDDSIYKGIADERILDITVRNLLQHTAGWDRDVSGDPMFMISEVLPKILSAPAQRVAIIQHMVTKPLDFTPGTRYAYSNLGYNVLGRVIESITGSSYENFAHQMICSPLQLDMHLAFNGAPAIISAMDVPTYFGGDHTFLRTSYHKDAGINIEAMDANGGWMATATDLARFTAAIDSKQTPLVDKESLVEMMAPSNANPIYGLGWFVNKEGNCWHTGSLVGTSAFMARLANGTIGVILFNERPESGTKKFFTELDNLLWSGIKKVKTWPTHDLFHDYQLAEDAPIAGSVPIPDTQVH